MINISNIYKWLELTGNKLNDNSKTKLALELIHEELDELHVGVINNDNDEIKDAVGDLIWVLSNLLYFKGITIEDFKDYFKLIEESNYSKFCSNEEDAIKTIELYKSGNHPDKLGVIIDCYYEKIDDYYIIKRNDGKVLKSYLYKSLNK